MENKMKLQKNNHIRGMIISTTALALSAVITFGYPASDSYFFEGSDVQSVTIQNDVYNVTFTDGEKDSISREDLDQMDNIGYSGWNRITLPNGRETVISARPGTTQENLVRGIGGVIMGASTIGLACNANKYVKRK